MANRPPERIVGREREDLILDILKRIDAATPHADSAAWERNWAEARKRFDANPCAASLVPPFIRSGQPVRKDGDFWRGLSELDYVQELHLWIATHLQECAHVHEYGCGTGFNMAALAAHLPHATFCGFDYSQSAVDLVRHASKTLGLPITAELCDMRAPHRIDVPPDDLGILTFGALEQVGNCEQIIEHFIEQKPLFVVHVEPVPELLDDNRMLDYLSLRFHEKRGYTRGLLPLLRKHPRIKVKSVERSNFGSLMLESYARILWHLK